jgi:superfamily II DNA or RNA helicase
VYGWESAAKAMGMKVQILHGKYVKDFLDLDADLYITTYGSAGNWIPCFKRMAGGPELFAMIADEVHLMHKKPLKWTQAWAGTRCKVRIGLTATPIRNRLPSLWGVLNSVQPKVWGTKVEFLERYSDAFMGQYGLELGAPTHVDELSKRLREVAIRRVWAEPGMDKYRPRLVRERIEVPISAKRRVKHLDRATKRALEKSYLAGQGLKLLSEQRQETGMLKVEWAINSGWAQKEALQHVRSIWWCWFKPQARALYDAAQSWGMPVDMITGESLSKKRAEVLAEWEHGDNSEPRILVATQGALNFCVNLVTAHTAVFLEYDWAPVNLVQAEKRHHRPGNTLAEVTASYLVIPGTTDDDIAEALYTKVEEDELIFGEAGQLEQVGQRTKHGIVTSSANALEELARSICGKRE